MSTTQAELNEKLNGKLIFFTLAPETCAIAALWVQSLNKQGREIATVSEASLKLLTDAGVGGGRKNGGGEVVPQIEITKVASLVGKPDGGYSANITVRLPRSMIYLKLAASFESETRCGTGMIVSVDVAGN